MVGNVAVCPATEAAPPADVRLTVQQLAQLVGMSPRNIRAHQARKLLAPPVRAGRVVYYHEGHVRRLEAIKALQRKGFNLVAIQAILSGRPDGDALATVLDSLAEERPHLVHALIRHGVVSRANGGALRIVRPRVLRSALDLHTAGTKVGPTLEVLIEVLDHIQSFTDELVRATSTRILSLAPDHDGPALSWEECDRRAADLAEGLAALLTEAFRVAVERSSQTVVPDSVARVVSGKVR